MDFRAVRLCALGLTGNLESPRGHKQGDFSRVATQLPELRIIRISTEKFLRQTAICWTSFEARQISADHAFVSARLCLKCASHKLAAELSGSAINQQDISGKNRPV